MQNINQDKGFIRKCRNDKIVSTIFLCIALLCASFILIIIGFILVNGLSTFFKKYDVNGQTYTINFFKFITGNTWFQSPNIYGIGYVIINTIYVTLLALLIAVPLSILSALFIDRIAPKKVSKVLNVSVELLASIPSIIFGVFGMGVITALIKNGALLFGIQTPGGMTTLAVVLVLALMIYPTITMVSVTAIHAVKNNLVEGSLALGATKLETNFKVVLTSAKSGIFAGIILGVGRALGEATAISMVCSVSDSGPNFDLFGTTRTLTTTILHGLNETTGMGVDIRFSVAIVLIIVILLTNILLNALKNRIGKIK